MSAKHTTGPWHTEDDKSFYVFGENREVICNANTHGNQRIIAAAPDLLAALENVVEWCDINGVGHAVGKARAAIAKARGV